MPTRLAGPYIARIVKVLLIASVLSLGVTEIAMSASTTDASPAGLPDISKVPMIQSAKGKVVLLDFWASWCVPCRKSFPWMNALQKKYGDQGLVVIAVNLDMVRADADEFLKAVPAQFRLEYDPKAELATKLDVSAMPTSFLLDRSGKIVKQHAGFREAQLAAREQEIEQLMK